MAKAKTVTKTELQSVEKEYHICPSCEQEYEEDEMVDLYAEPKVKLRSRRELCWLNKSEDRNEIYDAISVKSKGEISVCQHCAENMGVAWGPVGGRDLEIHVGGFTAELDPETTFTLGMCFGALGLILAQVIV